MDNVDWNRFYSPAIISSLFVKKPQELLPQTLTPIYVIHFLKSIGLGIIASAILAGGFVRLKSDENKTKGYVGVVGGILLFMLMIGRPAISSMMLSSIQADAFKSSNHLIKKQVEKLTKRGLSVEDKARFSKLIAQDKYFQEGSLAEYIDKYGNTVKYQPSADDVQKREQFLFMPRCCFPN